ncbi:CDP-6-deoxy-L-threo-D-glycero-4-hexulose-3- dehydrase reductase [Candidatus Kinetoplastibacterium sorsogonicusi]|uniref:CDP-6-deoxy-L-threo-D-glycero-4-hexulose-3-dehydrase reductase n=1 Tax=Candidatus Kinetoplastidibacterium kentomonadis TaxID=1576550 RepID=A0A3Q8ERD3_9PROT|nr:FAD-binding oxidoreductase [Candidatus Kinetoplastibacterium sorsogonicusi]AWD32504.1 CDP-6-deoxy-L-threo-D-glycero-4-hexulose-3- dehydrase reductase [Candidatus Kinetoplastibacterium sorsogonicusi]
MKNNHLININNELQNNYKKYNVKIISLKYISNYIIILKLKIVDIKKFFYNPGQYIKLYIDKDIRQYSIADYIDEYQIIELHIKYSYNGIFSKFLHEHKRNNIYQIEGPFGNFYIKDINNNNQIIIFIAGGTGFAAIKAIINNIIRNNYYYKKIYFYWGVSDINDFYMQDIIYYWQNKNKNFEYIPVISAYNKFKYSSHYKFGHLHDVVMNDFDDLSAIQCYACGSPDMVKIIYDNLIKYKKLSHDNFYSDVFIPKK